jgi:hypothetical protein
MNAIFMSLSRNRLLALFAISALVISSFGYVFTRHAGAADMLEVSDTLSDSDLGVGSNHTVRFAVPSGIPESGTFTITLEEEFNSTSSPLDLEDFDVATGTALTENTLDYNCSGSAHMSVATSTTANTFTFTVCLGNGGAIPAGGTTTVEIGTNATTTGTGDTQIVNPLVADSYDVTIQTSAGDVSKTLVAIIDDVVVTAAVDPTLTFVISGLPEGITINGSGTLTGTTTTATSLPFGVLAPGTPVTMAQRLQVTTNAVNGFSVTLNQDQALTSSSGATIDSFTDGGASSTPASWQAPSGYLDNDATYGHMGITSEDSTLTGGDVFGVDLWVGDFINNPREVMAATSTSDGLTTDLGSTTVGFQAEVMAYQEAGTYYTANLTYVATPVF